jgi:hypothetical protein
LFKKTLLAAMMAVVSVSLSAASIGLYYNPDHVDIDPGSPEAEASNTLDVLNSFGHDVQTFVDFSNGVPNADVLVFPEMEVDFANFDAATIALIQQYLNNGGGIIVMYTQEDLLAALFPGVQPFFGSTGTTSITGNAAGTAFAGGPATLNDANATGYMNDLPTGAVAFYLGIPFDSEFCDDDEPCAFDLLPGGQIASVWGVQVGMGRFVYYGWDNYRDDDEVADIQAWDSVLNSAVCYSSGSSTDPCPTNAVPEPSTYALMASGLGLLALKMRKRK